MATESTTFINLWDKAIETIKSSVSQEEFNSWFSRLHFGHVDGGKVTVYVPSAFFKDRFEGQYKVVVENALTSVCNKKYTLICEIKKNDEIIHPSTKSSKNEEKTTSLAQERANANLNPAYNFDSFVPGENSDFAYNAALAIAKNPGSVYNPCLLYGGVGLGKTHLLQSIGNYIVENSKLKVLYVTSENFTNEFIQSINDKNQRKFQNKYRKASVLLIDDIQFLEKKESTQNELFNTFNDLYDTGRQLVFTCDRPVAELRNMTDRLKSRFERGLNIDIQPPSYETRVAILKAKCKEKDFSMSDDVLEYIANSISSNVRALEACITKLMAYSRLLNKDISIETAREQLKQIISSNNDTSGISMDAIIKTVSTYFNVSPYDIKGKSKNQSVVLPRQISMYLCRKLTDFSTTEIASEFGGKNHTTVMYNVQKVESLMNTSDKDLAITIEKLSNQIKQEK